MTQPFTGHGDHPCDTRGSSPAGFVNKSQGYRDPLPVHGRRRRPDLGQLHRLHADGTGGPACSTCASRARAFSPTPPRMHPERASVERDDHLSRRPDDVLRGHPGAVRRFGNYFMPLQIGAPDMAFPRWNNLSYWMYVTGVCLASLRCWRRAATRPVPGVGLGALYPPLSTTEGRWLFDGSGDLRRPRLGCVLDPGAINIITTFLNMRAPRHDPVQGAAVRLVGLCHRLADPAVAAGAAGAITMLLTDRNSGTTSSTRPAAATRSCTSTSQVLRPPGSVYHHPARLRASSATSSRPLRASRSSATCRWSGRWSPSGPGLCRLGAPHVHRRHVLTFQQGYFMLATMTIAVPTGIKVFSDRHDGGGSIEFKTPMLWASASCSCSPSAA